MQAIITTFLIVLMVIIMPIYAEYLSYRIGMGWYNALRRNVSIKIKEDLEDVNKG